MTGKKRGWAALAVSCFVLLAMGYAGYQVYVITHPMYRTEVAVSFEMVESVEMTAAAAFSRQHVDGGGLLGYLAEDGERVRPGQLVAEGYADGEQANMRSEYRRLEKQKALLENSQNVEGSDLGVLSQQLQRGLYGLLDELDRQDFAATPERFDEYLLAANKVQILTGRSEGIPEQMARVQARMDELAAAQQTHTAVSAPVSGYFVSAGSIRPQPYSAEVLDGMNAGQLREALAGAAAAPAGGVGDIITDYHWSLYGTLEADEAVLLRQGAKVTLRLPEHSGIEMPVKTALLEKDEETGLVKVRVDCEYVSPEVVGLGIEQVELIVAAYEGIRVPVQAEHEIAYTDEEGNTRTARGVFVKLGNLMRFREITERLYETDRYILLPLEADEENKGKWENVKLYDEVIVQGVDLRDGKLM